MANNPFRVRQGIGVIDSFSSDANYLSTTGSTAKRGDIYFSTHTGTYRFYDGSSWQSVGKGSGGGIFPVRYLDNTSTSLPSFGSPYSPDGVAVVDGDLVLMTAQTSSSANGVYRATVSAGNLTAFDKQIFGQSPTAASTNGDFVWIQEGSANAAHLYVCYNNSSSWQDYISTGAANVSLSNLSATNINTYLNFNPSVGDGILRVDTESTANSTAAPNLNLQASSKSTGTGDGGNVNITAGTSAGGLQGIANITGRLINLPNASADPASPTAGSLYYNTTLNQYKYYNGTAWSTVGSGGGGGIVKAKLRDNSATTNTAGVAITNPYTCDGVVVSNGDQVLFTNLVSGNNEIYQAAISGGLITWTAVSAFNSSVTPSDGDLVIIQQGNSFADQIAKYTGSAWVMNDKIRFFNGSDYFEESSLNSASLANNQAAPANIYSIAYAGSENQIVEYSIVRGSAYEIGRILLTTDGSTVAITVDNAGLSSTGITFSADISGSNMRLRYTSDNSGSTGTMKWSVKRWSVSAGGPGGIPSYSTASSGVTGSGTNQQIAFWNSSSNITGNTNFSIDTSKSAIIYGSQEQVASTSVTLADNQASAATIFTYPVAYRYVIVEYGVSRNGTFRTGRLLIANDGTIASLSDDEVETTAVGILFSADISGGNVRVRYTTTSTGFAPVISFAYRRWA